MQKFWLLWGPHNLFLDNEIQLLEAFLAKGGRLFFALEPQTSHGLSSLLLRLGVKLQNNYVVAVMQTLFGRVINPSKTPLPTFSSEHNITKVFQKGAFAAFRLPMSLTKASATERGEDRDWEIEELVKSSQNSLAYGDKKT